MPSQFRILARQVTSRYLEPMQFLDLAGQSGTLYRFRNVVSPADLPAHSGNFVLLRSADDAGQVVACGTRRRLQDLAKIWNKITADDVLVFVRLNVSRTQRTHEHEDLAAALKPVRILFERD